MRSVRHQASANRTSYSLRGIFLDSDPHCLPTAFGAGQNVLGGISVSYRHDDRVPSAARVRRAGRRTLAGRDEASRLRFVLAVFTRIRRIRCHSRWDRSR